MILLNGSIHQHINGIKYYLITNYKSVEDDDVQLCATAADLDFIIYKHACDAFGYIIPDHYAIFAKEEVENFEEKMEDFFQKRYQLRSAIHDYLISNEVSEEDIKDKPIYSGCEYDYFPLKFKKEENNNSKSSTKQRNNPIINQFVR